jgi:hypothetical protein
MKIGYKGLFKDMSSGVGYSSKVIYEIDKIYSKTNIENPKVCSQDGYHYCNKLSDVFQHYPNDGKNRFFEIEVLGNFTDSSDKSITTSFKLLREIPNDILLQKRYDENLNIDLLKDIQTKFPMFHVGGSVGLYLHGVRLERWLGKTSSDIDMVSPYFVLPEGSVSEDGEEIEYLDAKASANDFDETFLVDGVKVDYRIDPKQRYEIIEHNGFKFKVSPILTILEAKMRYALHPSGRKHRDDIKEMVVRVKKPSTKNPDLTFDELFK